MSDEFEIKTEINQQCIQWLPSGEVSDVADKTRSVCQSLE